MEPSIEAVVAIETSLCHKVLGYTVIYCKTSLENGRYRG